MIMHNDFRIYCDVAHGVPAIFFKLAVVKCARSFLSRSLSHTQIVPVLTSLPRPINQSQYFDIYCGTQQILWHRFSRSCSLFACILFHWHILIRRLGELITNCFTSVPNSSHSDDERQFVNGILFDLQKPYEFVLVAWFALHFIFR